MKKIARDDAEIMDSIFFFARLRSRYYYYYTRALELAERIEDPYTLHPRKEIADAFINIGEAMAMAKILRGERHDLFFDADEAIARLEELTARIQKEMRSRYKKLKEEGRLPEEGLKINIQTPRGIY